MNNILSNNKAYQHDCPHSIRNELNLWNSRRIVQTIRRYIELNEDGDSDSDSSNATLKGNSDSFQALDYGCGVGLISQILSPYFDFILGIDCNIERVEDFNESVRCQGLSDRDLKAIQKDSIDSIDFLFENEEGELFDLVVCANTYHHIVDLSQLTSALARRLKPGAILAVIDLDSESEFGKELKERALKQEKYDGTVAHRGGLSQKKLRELFEGTGLFDEVLVEVSHSSTMSELRAIRGNNWSNDVESRGDLEVSWNVAIGRRAAS